MTSSTPSLDPRAVEVKFPDDELTVVLMDGRRLSVPLIWFPRLFTASLKQRSNFELLGGGIGIDCARPYFFESFAAGQTENDLENGLQPYTQLITLVLEALVGSDRRQVVQALCGSQSVSVLNGERS